MRICIFTNGQFGLHSLGLCVVLNVGRNEQKAGRSKSTNVCRHSESQANKLCQVYLFVLLLYYIFRKTCCDDLKANEKTGPVCKPYTNLCLCLYLNKKDFLSLKSNVTSVFLLFNLVWTFYSRHFTISPHSLTKPGLQLQFVLQMLKCCHSSLQLSCLVKYKK